MPRKHRPYKKNAPFRDAKLFLIVAEGEREDAYFRFFNRQNQRISVAIVPREQNQSAPKHFLERIEKYEKETGWSQSTDDILWFVLDVDRWQRKTITELNTICEANQNWFMGISNPCFEVWLLFHLIDTLEDNEDSGTDLKQKLHVLSGGGFEINRFAKLVNTAIENSEAADTNPRGYYPNRMQTKLHELAKQISEVLGNNWQN